MIAPGSVLRRRPPRWVMAAELVETNRLWARRVAAMQPEWAERLAAHLVKRCYGEPRWDARRGAAVTTRDGDAVRPADRRPPHRGTTASTAPARRELFIRHALVEGDWTTHHAFLGRNRRVLERVQGDGGAGTPQRPVRRRRRVRLLRRAARRRRRVRPATSTAGGSDAERDDPHLLDLTATSSPTAAGSASPTTPTAGARATSILPLTYRFDPDAPLDGVTVHVPLTALNQVTGAGSTGVPGYRASWSAALVRTLPKDVRRV